MNQDNELHLGSALFQNVFGILRAILVVATLWFFASICSSTYHQINPADLRDALIQSRPNLANWNPGLVTFIACLLHPLVFRYTIAPFAAILSVLFASAFYVKDIYAIPTYGAALHYVIASMFTLGYPKLNIDGGKKALKKGEVNLVDLIGGPGSVMVEPGSGAVFRHLRGGSTWRVASTYFLAPFETIAHTIDLDDQQADKNDVKCVTRDGIQIILRDVHFRYRIRMASGTTAPAGRSRENPFPFADDALFNMTNNLQVESSGDLEKWTTAAERIITGSITDFIASHDLDFMTAPRTNQWRPREELIDQLTREVRDRLARIGAELIWVDFGHMEIIEDAVDRQRENLWAAPMIGSADAARAYGDAKRKAYQDIGRAEAQAELVISIADALQDVNLQNQPADTVRRLLLARTAQVLDSMQAKSGAGDKEEKK